MSVQALAWVLEEAPDLPPHLVGVLMGVANHAGRDGTGSYATQETLARYARKSARAVRNDLEALLSLGLIRKGDQRLVSHLAADKRPVVYDLAMERKRSVNEPDAASEPALGRKPTSGREGEPQPGNDRGSGGSTVPPGSRAPGGTRRSSGRKPTSKPAGSGLPTEPSLNRTEPPPPTPSGEQTACAEAEAKPGEGDQIPNDDLEDLVAEILKKRPEWKPKSIARVLERPDVAARPWPLRREAARIVLLDPATKLPGRLAADGPWWAEAAAALEVHDVVDFPPWCGTCGPNRRLEGPDGEDMGRCPLCHPMASRRLA